MQLQLNTATPGMILLCCVLMFLTVPALILFYYGLSGEKHFSNLLIRCLASTFWTIALFYVAGYSLCFSGNIAGIIGNLDCAFFRNLVSVTTPSSAPSEQAILFAAGQMIYAIIASILITIITAKHLPFGKAMLFLSGWLFIVYFPLVHTIWGGGILQQWGVLDFSGGLVLHNITGMAALAFAVFVARSEADEEGMHGKVFIALGAALFFLGSYGLNIFNGLRIGLHTSVAMNNTDIAASLGAFTWLMLDWRVSKDLDVRGLLTGAMAGLVAIAPAAGYVSPSAALIIGIVGASACHFVFNLRYRFGFDQPFDLWATQGVGGFIGIVLVSVFSTIAYNPGTGTNGLLGGNAAFFLKEIGAALFSSIWAFGFSYGMLTIIDKLGHAEAHKDLKSSSPLYLSLSKRSSPYIQS